MTTMDGRDSAGRKISLLNSQGSGDVAPNPVRSTTLSIAPAAASLTRPHLQHHNYNYPQKQLLHQQQPQPPQYPNALPPIFATAAAHHHHHTHSRASSTSCASTPCLSPPQTPQLVRSDSSDSRAFGTPSPITPSYNSFEQGRNSAASLQQQQHSSSQYFRGSAKSLQHYHFVNSRTTSSASLASSQQPSAKMDDPIASLYPPIPDATGMLSSAYPMQPQIINSQLPLQQDPASMYRSSNSPASEPSRVSTVSAASTSNTTAGAAKATPKKNQYPCPMAKQFNCNDFFTTSGHAARHAKKHTGKKDAFCPECNKAFTRKDNMEQHRRTHQNGRGAGRTTDDKVKKATKVPAKKTSSIKAEQQSDLLEAAVEQQLQQQRQEEQQQQVAAQLQAVTQAQIGLAQQQQHLQAVEAALLNPSASGPYFLSSLDTGPIPSLPMPTMHDMSMRPPLHRSNLTTSLDYIPPLLGPLDPETLNYSYPSPGLSNGLNSLALAASEHRRLSEEKAKTPPSDPIETPLTESP